MKKKELIVALSEELETTQKDAREVLEGVFNVIEGALSEEKSVPLSIGKLEVRDRAARKGRNPSTGAEIDIPATKALALKVGTHGRNLAKSIVK